MTKLTLNDPHDVLPDPNNPYKEIFYAIHSFNHSQHVKS